MPCFKGRVCNARRADGVTFLILCVVWLAGSWARAEDYPHLLLGNPSDAKEDAAEKNNFLMKKKYFALSYNSKMGTPNWVSWHLTKEDQGDAPRKRLFDTDTALPQGFTLISHKDYVGSGFDRGHMCPHSDRAADEESSFATFIMTNIIPQAPNVNQKAWDQMESYCRELTTKHRRLYIVAGPAGSGGRGSHGFRTSIANGKVTVPSLCWKIVVVVPDSGADDVAKINENTRVIAVMMPNDNSVGLEWAQFRTSIDEIEKKTGLNFLTSLPDQQLARSLKDDVDEVPIPQPVAIHHGE